MKKLLLVLMVLVLSMVGSGVVHADAYTGVSITAISADAVATIVAPIVTSIQALSTQVANVTVSGLNPSATPVSGFSTFVMGGANGGIQVAVQDTTKCNATYGIIADENWTYYAVTPTAGTFATVTSIFAYCNSVSGTVTVGMGTSTITSYSPTAAVPYMNVPNLAYKKSVVDQVIWIIFAGIANGSNSGATICYIEK
jgi:tetrahydromethanopterin S-methyltransferase subunit B